MSWWPCCRYRSDHRSRPAAELFQRQRDTIRNVELLDVFDESAPPALRGIRGEALSRSLSDLVADSAQRGRCRLVEDVEKLHVPEALIAQAARHLPDRTAAAGLPAALDALCAG